MAHFGLKADEDDGRPSRDPVEDEALNSAISQFPYRSLTDALVHDYLKDGNMQYYSIHPQSLLRDYDAWWTARETQEPLSPSLTCLLLQICANAAQSLNTPLSQQLQYDLTESNAQTSSRLSKAADSLGRTMPSGSGGLYRVMQLLLAAAWLKTEGRIVDGWHALSVAVREAQECAPGAPDTSRPSNDMNAENWRRIWSFILVWDWQLAEWLARPMLTEASDVKPLPDPSVDDCRNGQPSPVCNLCEQSKLVRTLRSQFGRLSELEDIGQIHRAVEIIDQWKEGLPRFLRMNDCDQKWDEQCPWLPLQRASLNCFAQMARLTPLKQFMTKAIGDERLGVSTSDLTHLAARTSIDCIDAAATLCQAMSPVKKAFHFVVFAYFDAATVICSALIQDRDGSLYGWPQLLQKAKEALVGLETLSEHTMSAKWSAQILRWLLKKLAQPEAGPERRVNPRPANGPIPATDGAESMISPTLKQRQETGRNAPDKTQPGTATQDDVQNISTPPCQPHAPLTLDTRDVDSDDLPWLSSPSLSLQQLPDLDMGGLESIWDWEAIGVAFDFEDD